MKNSILIVDDDVQIRMILKTVFNHAGYTVILAESGEKALAVLEGVKPTLVLMDCVMPGLSGTETLKEIRRNACNDVARVPIIGMSSSAHLCDQEVFDYFLEKPLNVFEIVDVVEQVIHIRSH